MKKIFILIMVLISVQQTKAQFSNTTWKGTFKVPQEMDLELQFKTDSLLLNLPGNGDIVETMSYKISSDTMTIMKLDGRSECSDTTAATYKISIKDKKLFISVLHDDCTGRSGAWPEQGLEKME